MVSHQERRKTRIVPDHVGWWRQRADCLQQLAQSHKQEQSKEWTNASAKKPAPQQKESQRVDQTGAYDQQRVSGPGIFGKIRIESRGQVVERVADSRCRSDSRADKCLRPKPQREDNSGHEQAQEQSAPMVGAFG